MKEITEVVLDDDTIEMIESLIRWFSEDTGGETTPSEVIRVIVKYIYYNAVIARERIKGHASA